mmetsp:Transcript_33049/g.79885  ORF Transcript_33049/g.79885 Transcript_33049/m.79885 type:complete len:222 (+) Transcript_33049:64-729(+)
MFMMSSKTFKSLLLCLFGLYRTEALLSSTWHKDRYWFSSSKMANSNSEVDDPYDPCFSGGCISNLSVHIGYLDRSLRKSSGTGLFDWINQRSEDATVTTAALLDENQRFGVLSHGTQPDPIFNYGNKASLELFGYKIEDLCRTASRLSTVPELMKDRENLIKDIETCGYGYIDDAVRVKSDGELFVIDRILVWTLFDKTDKRIGLAAVYDKENARTYVAQT